ncbi:MAG TPA: PIN domain-containing protein [Galbitalea sp.]
MGSATRRAASKRSSPRSGALLAIVDTGPLYAAADETDANHDASLETLERGDLELVIPALVVAETTYLVGRRLGAVAEARFLEALADHEVDVPSGPDWSRIAELVEEYLDFPLGGTDASVVALAERLDTDVVITLDRRHFGAIRPRHCEALSLLPA